MAIVSPPNPDDPVIRQQLEEMGAEMVRARIANGLWPAHLLEIARRWLREKDQEAETSRAEDRALARAANDAAERASAAAERAAKAAERQAEAAEKANTRATIALIMAAISIAATIIGILITHWDAISGKLK